MAEPVSLKRLIEALAGAVISAQDRIEKHQIANIGQYFDEKSRRPISVNVRLPDLSLEAEEDDEIEISIPLLALVGSSLLHIKDMNVEFDVDLSNLETEDSGKSDQTDFSDELQKQGWGGLGKSNSIGVDWQSGRDKKMARLSIRVEAQEPTEGMARLIQRLNKLI